MSAFLVNDYHIAYLVQAGVKFGLLEPEEGPAVGECLYLTNLVSLAHRYPEDGDLDGVARTWRGDGEGVRYLPPIVTEEIEPLVVLKGLRCYEYQACEFAEWSESDAHVFCEALAEVALATLPERLREVVPNKWSPQVCEPRVYQSRAYEESRGWEIREGVRS